MCEKTAYEIRELQAPSDPSAYQWLEDGQEIPGATAAGYTVPANKAVGKYTYIRRSKREGCDWASSNAYTVEVITCKTIGPDDPEGTKGFLQDPRDQKVYKTVKMADGKVWMAENLNYQVGMTFNQQSNQANGQPFTSTENGVPAIGSFWCPAVAGATVSADKNTCTVYGALYTWETAMSPDGKGTWDESTVSGNYYPTGVPTAGGSVVRGICPTGWHLPSDYEWAQMLDAVEGNTTFTSQTETGWWGTDAGVKLKSASTYVGADPGTGAWVDHDNRGTDLTGFGAVPAGYRLSTGEKFNNRGTYAFFWPSTAASPNAAADRRLYSSSAQVWRSTVPRSFGFPVRCVRD